MTDVRPFFACGWQIGQLTGWGQFGTHFARTLHSAGYRVILPGIPDKAGVLPLDWPLLSSLVGPLPETEPGWLCMAIGNGMEERPTGLPGSISVAGIIFCEDTGAIDPVKLNAYDVIVAGSRWTERVLREKGVERVVLAHQGYDSRVFFPFSRQDSDSGDWNGSHFSPKLPRIAAQYSNESASMATLTRPLVFSGGKLEFRKGQDIVIEAFKRFRATPEGRDAVLVTAWDNQWPKTMDGIWLSGYVKGVPSIRNNRADIVPWLVANGLPAESVVDCGRLTPPELAHVMRSCTVGVFPNRAESGTNLVLVEALACGLPVIASQGHGHDDVIDRERAVRFGGPDMSVPEGCRLYQSMEGWHETDVDAIVAQLRRDLTSPTMAEDYSYWPWETRGPAMAQAIIESAQVPA